MKVLLLLATLHPWFQQMVEHHNLIRYEHGLVALSIDDQLMKEADEHAQWMAENKILRHADITYGSENIARAKVKPKEVVDLWMDSPGHRSNILNPKWQRIGVAVYKSDDGDYWWCVRFSK